MTPTSPPGTAFVPASDPDDLLAQVHHFVDVGSTFGAGMAAAMSEQARDELTHLRSEGWRVCIEVSVDAAGYAKVLLSAVSPSGIARKAFAEIAQGTASAMH